MTEQITIKLNKELFRPLMEELKIFAGQGISDSDSDLVGKSLFFAYFFIATKIPEYGGKTNMDMLMNMRKTEKAEGILRFLNEYYIFKRKGLPEYKKHSAGNKK